MTTKTSSTSVPTSTPVMHIRDMPHDRPRENNHTDIQLDGPWVVRKYEYPFPSIANGYYQLYHFHPPDTLVHVRSDFDRPPSHQATLGLVSSPAGIPDKAVGHARCVVCGVIAPAEALGFLEMCKWKN